MGTGEWIYKGWGFLFLCLSVLPLQRGNLQTRAVQVDPLDSIECHVVQQNFKMLLVGWLVARKRGDNKGMRRGEQLQEVRPEFEVPGFDIKPLQAVRLSTEVVHQGLAVKMAVQMCAPILDELLEMRHQELALGGEDVPP
jgi:hypothetical protein